MRARRGMFRALLLISLMFVALALYCTTLETSPRSVALVAVCKLSITNRARFERAFQTWLKLRGTSEIIVIDWNSTVQVAELIRKTIAVSGKSRKTVTIRVVRVSHGPSVDWRISVAFNVALRNVRSDVVLKLDIDSLVAPDFLEKNMINSRMFRYGDWRKARDSNDLHLNGVFIASTSHLQAVHGMDERFSLYGWDDSDLYNRLTAHLQKTTTSETCISCDLVRSTKASESSLITHMIHKRDLDEAQENWSTCFNRLSVKEVLPWSGTMGGNVVCQRIEQDRTLPLETQSCFISSNVAAIGKTLAESRCDEIVCACESETHVVVGTELWARACPSREPVLKRARRNCHHRGRLRRSN